MFSFSCLEYYTRHSRGKTFLMSDLLIFLLTYILMHFVYKYFIKQFPTLQMFNIIWQFLPNKQTNYCIHGWGHWERIIVRGYQLSTTAGVPSNVLGVEILNKFENKRWDLVVQYNLRQIILFILSFFPLIN